MMLLMLIFGVVLDLTESIYDDDFTVFLGARADS
jgi:hypothetical protein